MAALKKSDEQTIGLTIKPKYDVYIFHPPSEFRQNPDWERKHTTPCIKQARLHAEELMQTNNYPKVEIQKKYFDAKKDCAASCTMKVYEKNRAARPYKMIAGALLIACVIILCAIMVILNP